MFHAGVPAPGISETIMRPARQGEFIDICLSAATPVGDRVMNLTMRGRPVAVGVAAPAFKGEQGEALAGRCGAPGASQVQRDLAVIVKDTQVMIGAGLGGQVHQILHRQMRPGVGQRDPGALFELFDGAGGHDGDGESVVFP